MPDGNQNIEQLLEQVTSTVKASTEAFKVQAEKALVEAQKSGALSTETKAAVDKMATDMNLLKEAQAGLKAQVGEVEQHVAGQGSRGAAAQPKSLGEQLVESASFKDFMAKGARGGVKISIQAAITGANTGALTRPLYETEPIKLPMQRLTLRDLLPVVPIQTSSVDYPKQTTRTNAAAMVAEAAAKPYSAYVWSNATATVRTIAHLAKLTRQAMDDAPRLVAEVDSEMRYGLRLVEEAQILTGDGTGQNLNGLVTQATAYAAPIVVADATSIDLIRLAMLQAALALYPADGIVLNEADWAFIELTKTADGAYLFAQPQGTVQPRLWGLPVVATPSMTIDKFLVGSFRFGATLYDRMGVEVLISTENDDDFEKNLATMRAEERLALAVKRPGAFIYGDFGRV